uniref:Uncharacterized protein n=1 Tax=Arundo donax TaxID=35708 RepID=A0A0A9GZT9_ARUDO
MVHLLSNHSSLILSLRV